MSFAVLAPDAAIPLKPKRRGVLSALTVSMSACALILAACGDKNKDKPASQTAAKVNKEEITVHQINYVLSQQRALPADQAASATKQVLERLIDQELALQKAQDQKLDRDPRVVQQLEAARRDIIARAYIERIGAGATKPVPAEVKAYYEAHPALFSQRKVYTLQELQVEAKPEQVATLREKLAASKDMPEFVAYLKANDFKFAANQGTRAAEQLPLAVLDKFAAMKDGERTLSPIPRGVRVLAVLAVREQPVDEAHAAPAIEQFLTNERKRKLVDDDLKALRSSAKIEYVGSFAQGVPDGAASPAASAAEPAAILPMTPAASQAVGESDVAAEPSVAAPSTKAIEKGIKGLK